MRALKIGNRVIRHFGRPFIVAEAGVNHNGALEKAFQMIHLAKASGADAVKFQNFTAEEFVGDPGIKFTYKSQGKKITESMLDMFKRYEFSPEEWKLIKKRCDAEGIMFLSTAQNRSDLDLLLKLGVKAVKVGSDDFTNIPLLKDYAATGLPLILSCGMADFSEVHQSLDAVGALDGYPTVLLLCTSEYPTPPEDVNILKLRTLSNAFPMVPMGFSDHTQGPLASVMAVAFGACIFEKHFTLDHSLPGPDHWFSEDPAGLKAWIGSIRIAHTMIGDHIVRPTREEMETRKISRRSIYALRDIKKGEIFGANIGLKRPGTGLGAVFIERVTGLKAARRIDKGTMLKWGDIR